MLDFGVWSGAGTTPQGALWKLPLDMSYEEFLPVIEAHSLSKAALMHAGVVGDGAGRPRQDRQPLHRRWTGAHDQVASTIRGAAAGVMQMFRVLARELGRYGIRLNTVSRGPVVEVDEFVREQPGRARG